MSNGDEGNIAIYDNEIKELILTIRGKQVLLDSDVARLYGYETKTVNQAANRNIKRFPPEFRFQLTNEESEKVLRSQIVTASKRNERYRPFVFTEQGIGMLSGILKNDTAIQVSVGIMNAFVHMRQFLGTNKDIYKKIVSMDNKIMEHDHRFNQVFELLQSSEKPPLQGIFYKGQFYDAFKLVVNLIRSAKDNIVIIDNYFDDSILDILVNKKDGVGITVITNNPKRLSQVNLLKFSKQYGQISLIESKDFHDRFIILDNSEVYAFGASFKDLGNKCFEVSKNEATDYFISYVNRIVWSE